MSISSMVPAALSLSSAAAWGTADFSGGLAAKRTSAFAIVVVAHGTGLLFMLALALGWHDPLPGRAALLWGCAAGVSGGVGLAALYRALAVGTMGINAPVAAVITAMLPVMVSFRTEGPPGALRLVGFGVALISIWLIAMPAGEMGRPRGLGLAVLAGIGFSGFLVLSRQAGQHSLFWPLATARLASLCLMLIMLAVTRAEWKPNPRLLGYMIAAGLLDAGGNALFVLATQRGRLDVAAVLSSFYPASTVLLARFVLKERITLLQGTGLAGALISLPLIAAR